MAIKCAVKTVRYRGFWSCLRDPRGAFAEFSSRLAWAPVMI
jgi:hypothetical protein